MLGCSHCSHSSLCLLFQFKIKVHVFQFKGTASSKDKCCGFATREMLTLACSASANSDFRSLEIGALDFHNVINWCWKQLALFSTGTLTTCDSPAEKYSLAYSVDFQGSNRDQRTHHSIEVEVSIVSSHLRLRFVIGYRMVLQERRNDFLFSSLNYSSGWNAHALKIRTLNWHTVIIHKAK
jgi:hypothetical protein